MVHPIDQSKCTHVFLPVRSINPPLAPFYLHAFCVRCAKKISVRRVCIDPLLDPPLIQEEKELLRSITKNGERFGHIWRISLQGNIPEEYLGSKRDRDHTNWYTCERCTIHHQEIIYPFDGLKTIYRDAFYTSDGHKLDEEPLLCPAARGASDLLGR